MDVPCDSALPQLSRLLDSATVGAALGARLARKLRAHPRYVRYKPANKAIVLYEIETGGRQEFAVLSVAALRDLRRSLSRESTLEIVQRSQDRCTVVEPVFFLDDLQALVEWYPVNRMMPGLSFETRFVREALLNAGRRIAADQKPEVVVYKPERRAILRWGDSYLRVYAREEDFRVSRRNTDISSCVAGILSPPRIRDFPEHRIFVQPEFVGRHLKDTEENLASVGRTIRKLHSATVPGLDVFSHEAHFDLARKTAEHVTHLLPHVTKRTQGLVEGLRRRLPNSSSFVPSHGDLHRGQLLNSEGGLSVLDFDHMALADPSNDLSTYAAHAIRDEPGAALPAVSRALTSLVDGYGGRPENLDWYLACAILRRAAFPFRLLEPDWPLGIEKHLHAAERFAG